MKSNKSANPTDKHVGSRVRMRRMMLGLSQEKLGEGLGVTFQQVQKYEKGANRIGAGRLQQIATVLEVTEAYFFEGAPGVGTRVTSTIVDPIQAMGMTHGGLALAKAFNAITNAKLRSTIVELAERMAEAA
jgi:transcriptional regulator with XRE-family HTH domain